MNKVIFGLVNLVVLSLVACGGGASSEDDATAASDLSSGTFECTAAKTTKHPSFAQGASLSLKASGASLEPTGSKTPIPLKKAPAAASTKFAGFERYTATVDGKDVQVLVKALANGDEAVHLSRPFGSEDYLCTPQKASRGDAGKHKTGKAKKKLAELEVCAFGGEDVGDCESGACRPSADDDEAASRCE